jgi:predicted transcriptional regulator
MTAITVTVKVSEELAHQLETIPDMEQFTKDAWAAKVKADHAKTLEEHCMYEFEGDTIPEEHLDSVMRGLADLERGDVMPAEEYFAQRREERKKRAEAQARASRSGAVAA